MYKMWLQVRISSEIFNVFDVLIVKIVVFQHRKAFKVPQHRQQAMWALLREVRTVDKQNDQIWNGASVYAGTG